MTSNRELRAALEMFVRSPGPLIIATDFDGVLAPLRDDPTMSRSLPRSAAALERLNGARNGDISIAFVSGRQIEQVMLYAAPPPGSFVFGTHGAQSGVVDQNGNLEIHQSAMPLEGEQALTLALAKAEELAHTARGAWVEHKKTAVVLHTRLTNPENRARIEQEFRAYVAGLKVYTMLGHDVTEVSATKVTKGQVVRQLRENLGARAVLYFGDDVTDETVFTTLSGADLGIKVGPGSTAANYRVENPDQVSFILETIAGIVTNDL